MSKKVLVLLADGFEDVEAVTPIDYLKRAGVAVTTASISDSTTVTSRWGQIKMTADTTLKELVPKELAPGACCFDAIVLPGGLPGVEKLSACERTGALVKEMAAAGKLICAICAAGAMVLAPLGVLSGKKFTCYPGMEKKVAPEHGCQWTDARVVVDGNFITSRAAGTSGEWSIAIIRELLGEEDAKKVADTVLV